MVLNPFISVILPAYNAAEFLNESIDSILHQTYQNFELIIVNDGSTDNTQAIIEQYADPRIKCIQHDQNKGLVNCLNEAITLSKGEYIVRMDADDIAFNNRIQLQVAYLNEHPAVSIVGTHALFFEKDINAQLPNWELDLNTNTVSEIKKALAWENCIIHPTVCIRSEVAKSLLYDVAQINYEDYDLWMRAIAHNLIIAKINEPLLYYRVQAGSITQSSIRKANFYFQKVGIKFHFIKASISKGTFNLFVGKVCITLFVDLIMGLGKALKQTTK